MAGTVSAQAERVFQDLLIYNSVRGTDSTGAASIKRQLSQGKLEVVVAKELGNPYELLNITRKDQLDFNDVRAGTQRALIGHCRSKTVGPASRKNAHPFVFENIVGTHNGTLDWSTHKSLKMYSKFDTDSECLFAEINDFGIAETMKKLTAKDAYALVWFDARDNSINFLRNKERPLHYAFSKNHEELWWSSEFCHLAAAFSKIPHDEKCIYELPENTHMSWIIPESGKAFEKARATKREAKTSAPFVWNGGRNSIGSSNFTSVLGSNNDDEGSRHAYDSDDYSNGIPYWDANNFCFSKYSLVEYKYKFAWNDYGPWFETPQLLWDNLTFDNQVLKASKSMVPMGVVVAAGVMNEVVKRRGLGEQESGTKGGHKEVDTNKANADKIISMRNKVKQIRLDKLRESVDKTVEFLVYDNENHQVFWNKQDKIWKDWTFMGMGMDPAWKRQTSQFCPLFVPFTQLDIAARHEFKHVGKKKRRVTYYRGFKDDNGKQDMLVKDSFEKLMEAGCTNCHRKPAWGNRVHFLNHSDFFCEFCEKDVELVRSFKKIA